VTQSIYSWTGIEDWSELDDVFEHNLHRLDLGVSYRSTMEIMEVANRILANNSIGVKAIVPVQHSGPKPLFTEVSDFQDLLEKLDGAITAFLEQGYSRIAIIAKDPRLCEAFYTEYCAFHGASTVQFIQHAEDELKSSVIFISAALVKGLEFDAVIIPSTYGDSLLDARLLFVSVSRAQEALHLLYHQYPGPLQEPLTAHDAPISFTNKEG
jgi:DNA helicase-2/ATP-dependent DNA helicase PcrA